MPGFEEALIGRILGEAVKPIVGGTRQALARRGLLRSDVYTTLGLLSSERNPAPSALGTLFALPVGFTRKDVESALAQPEGHVLVRLVISLKVDSSGALPEEFEKKIKRSFHSLIMAQAVDRYDRMERRQVQPRIPRGNLSAGKLEHYVDQLYDSLVEACGIWAAKLQRSLKNPEQGLDWAYGFISNFRLGEIERYLEKISATSQPSRPPFESWHASYKSAFLAHHSTMQVPDLLLRKSVPYQALYIDGDFIPVSDSARELVDAGRGSSSSSVAVTLGGLVNRMSRTVLLGDPGAGKSTTSTVIANGFISDDNCIPFIIPLKSLAVQDFGFSVEEAVDTILRVRYQSPAPPGLVRNLLVEGRGFLVFDGLDELTDGTKRNAVVQTIDAVAAIFPLCKILVTSRRIGYLTGRLSPEFFDEFLIGGFPDAKVEAYAGRWFSLEQNLTPVELNATVRSFMEISRPIADLRSNPLMLAFICVLYRGRRTIPQRRPEIFRQCVDLFLQQWDRSRGIWDFDVDLDLVELALAYIAHAVMNCPGFRAGVTERDVYEIVTQPLLSEGVPDARSARNIARELLRLCRGRAWIFTDVALNDRGEDLFLFTHASFMEYFAALHIHRTNGGAAEVADLLIPEVADGKWEVLAQICIALKMRNKVGGSAEMIDRFLAKVEDLIKVKRNLYKFGPSNQVVLRDELNRADNKDVALLDFLLRASESLPLASHSFEKLVEISVEHFVSRRSVSLSALFNVDYRYVDAVYAKLRNVLGRAVQEYGESPAHFSELPAAKVWFAVHIGYIAREPLAHLVDPLVLNKARRSIVSSGSLARLETSQNAFSWNIYLQAGGVKSEFDGEDFTRIFESCTPAMPGFGPPSTAVWIIDCFSADFRRNLPYGDAARLLGCFSWILKEGGFDNRFPDGSSLQGVELDALLKSSKVLSAYREDVQLGWIAVVMGMHELWEMTTRKTRGEMVALAGMGGVLAQAVRRFPSCGKYISEWLDGDVDIWFHEGTASA
ncbi:NACHT domain-containing protein [Lentzea fradiae]|uniref:NACHT domain-containing protein n=1 Tax=Lentzea fradiae TaxID=200378 RepID=A0A1G7NTK0_9PSEU|nr:NACHT domain-containing protein [Lentzea fradiae]SDF77247.1 NACHT domain-containing protein [Lentzea fradiae]